MTIGWWKQVLRPVLLPVAGTLGSVHPNWITLSAFAAGVLAAATLAVSRDRPALSAVAAILLLVQILGDYLDGLVARMTHRESPFGAVLDRGLDRAADLLLCSALAVSLGASAGEILGATASLAAFFAIYYTAEHVRERRFDPAISRTDLHLALLAFLLGRSILTR